MCGFFSSPAPGRAPSGRPLGPRESAAPEFTRWRLRRGLSARAIAAQLSGYYQTPTTWQTVHGWEAGLWRPNEERLEALAKMAGGQFPHHAVDPVWLERVAGWFGLSIPSGGDDAA